MRAVAGYSICVVGGGSLPGDVLNRIEDGVDLGGDHAVENIPAVTPVLNQASLAQDSQLLRNVGLAKAQVSFHMADTVLAVPQNLQDRYTCGVHQNLEDLYLKVIGLEFCWFF